MNFAKNYFMNRLILLYILTAFSAVLALQIPSSNAGFQTSGEKIELLNADSLTGTTEEAQGIHRSYEGNVSFRQGDVFVKCSKAFHNISENTIDLSGSVVITQQDMRLTSPKVFYNGNTKIAQSYKTITITDKNMKLTADKGYYNTNTAVANFYGNVKIDDDTVHIKSDSVEYNRRTLFSKAYGKAQVEDDSTIIYGDYLEHQRRTRDSKAIGNVIVKGKYNATYLTADTIINNAQMHYTLAQKNPILFKIDTLKPRSKSTINQKDSAQIMEFDTMSIAADIMESIRMQGDERYIFSGQTEVYKNNLQAAADTIIYYRERELIYMIGSPVVWYDSTQLIGDTISLYMRNNKPDKVIAEGAAFATIQNDTLNPEKINQLMGHTITIVFKNDTIDKINSFGDAKSLLFMESEDGNDNGAALTSADTIKVTFDKGEATHFIGLGGIVGEAIPEEIIMQNVRQYYLPDFKKKFDKPKKKSLPKCE